MTAEAELCQSARSVVRDSILSALRLAKRHGGRQDLIQLAGILECEVTLLRQELRESGKTYPQCEEG